MKTITIKQPWASLIIEGIKDIENRTWPTKFRGRVLIHSGVKIDQSYFTEKIWDIPLDVQKNGREAILRGMPIGSIIGSVEIVDCVVNHPSIWAEPEYDTICKVGGCGSPRCDGCDKLKTIKTYNWVLANPIKFPEPIPAKGKLSFWEYEGELPEII